jgi:hypothetical protein
MAMLLLIVALTCRPGERLLDLSDKLPSGVRYVDLVISVKPFYTRVYIYQLGFPDSFQPCCGNKPTSVLRLPVTGGHFCVRQSQPQMEWHIRALLRSDVEM